MKNLKFNFAATIALLTIGGTLITHASIFKKTKASPTLFSDCYSTLTYTSQPVCFRENLVINQASCGFAQGQLNKPVYSNVAPMDALECGESGSIFCCAKIRIASQQCGLLQVQFPNGTFNYAVIDEIYCKMANAPSAQ